MKLSKYKNNYTKKKAYKKNYSVVIRKESFFLVIVTI